MLTNFCYLLLFLFSKYVKNEIQIYMWQSSKKNIDKQFWNVTKIYIFAGFSEAPINPKNDYWCATCSLLQFNGDHSLPFGCFIPFHLSKQCKMKNTPNYWKIISTLIKKKVKVLKMAFDVTIFQLAIHFSTKAIFWSVNSWKYF